MVDLKARLKGLNLLRRNSLAPSVTSSDDHSIHEERKGSGGSLSPGRSRRRSLTGSRSRDAAGSPMSPRSPRSPRNTTGEVSEHDEHDPHRHPNGHLDHLGFLGGLMAGRRRRPSTATSTVPASPSLLARDSNSNSNNLTDDSHPEEDERASAATTSMTSPDDAPVDQMAASDRPKATGGVGPAETLASSNQSPSGTTSPGADRPLFGSSPAAATAANPTAPAINSTTDSSPTLPSIHEHPASPVPVADEAASEPTSGAVTEAATPEAAAAADATAATAAPSRQDAPAQPAQPAQPPPPSSPSPQLQPPPLLLASPLSPADEDVVSPISLEPGSPGSLLLLPPRVSPAATRPGVPRRQSLLPNRQSTLIKALLTSGHAQDLSYPVRDPDELLPISPNMVTRKIWVKRPGASPTLITINEDDLVDDVRDMILRKYANSLGRQFDAPDLTIRIPPRDQPPRHLQPDEPMGRTLDAYFAGGQTADDALLIDVPTRRTPKASPNPRFYQGVDDRPHESGNDYFPPYPPPPPITHSHHSNHSAAPAPANAGLTANGAHTVHFPSSMAILGNGQLPPLPSPGGTRRMGSSRPKMQRLHTASPISTATANGHAPHPQGASTTSVGTHYSSRPPRSRTHSAASSDQSNHPPHPHQPHQPHQPPAPPPMPTPPVPERVASPPPPRIASPRPSNRTKKKKNVEHPSLPPGMLNGAVPPINVLIVEDNIINLKLLEAFVKRLKVRWQTAMNGREAVNKWRSGGFHLVLMDIQLPVMNGLEATREIRRIEKVNSIGVFSSSASSAPEDVKPELVEEDKLANTEMFKSPVIIVALTASSLQSDRHEALAAGCNDFLTKPVNFVWLERKVMEWGCMQALIDFDGWRKWKDFSQKTEDDDTAKKAVAAKAKATKKNHRLSMTSAAA